MSYWILGMIIVAAIFFMRDSMKDNMKKLTPENEKKPVKKGEVIKNIITGTILFVWFIPLVIFLVGNMQTSDKIFYGTLYLFITVAILLAIVQCKSHGRSYYAFSLEGYLGSLLICSIIICIVPGIFWVNSSIDERAQIEKKQYLAWKESTDTLPGFKYIHQSCQMIADPGYIIELQMASTTHQYKNRYTNDVHTYVSVKGPHDQRIVELDRGSCSINDLSIKY